LSDAGRLTLFQSWAAEEASGYDERVAAIQDRARDAIAEEGARKALLDSIADVTEL
jgi:hypothetical protein